MIFFESLQIALGNRVTIDNSIWHRLYKLCKKQIQAGIGFTAIGE